MKKEELEQLTDEEIQKKLKSTKSMIWVFVGLIAALLFFEVRAFVSGAGVSPMSVITLCTIGGLVSLFPDLKKLQEETKRRV